MQLTGAANANVATLFESAATERGEAPAVLTPDGRCLWTFAGLAAGAAKMAAAIEQRGVGRGDRVVLLTSDPRRATCAAVGALWGGATLVIPPRAAGLRQALEVAGRAKPRVVIGSRAVWAAAALLRPSLLAAPAWMTVSSGADVRRAGASSEARPELCGHGDVALISYTSGTTGPPTPVARSHGVLQAQHLQLRRLRRPMPGDLDLVGLPLLVLHNLACGTPSVLPPSGSPLLAGYGRQVATTIRERGVTTAAGFPSMFEALTREARPDDLAALRSIHIGGAWVRPSLVRQLATVAPRAEITIVYGSTEAEPISAIGAEEYLDRERDTLAGRGICLGRPVAEVQIAPDPADGQKLTEHCNTSPSAVVGAIRVRGDHVAASHTEFVETGDVGWQDRQGRLWLMGRQRHVADGSLFPAQIEPAVLAALPWAVGAALVNVETDGRTRAVLVVEPIEDAPSTSRDVRQAEIAALLATHGSLGLTVAVERIPRDCTIAAKIDYRRLAAMLRQRHW